MMFIVLLLILTWGKGGIAEVRKCCSLSEAIYAMAHESDVSIGDAASQIGISEGLLYRALNCNDGTSLSPERLLAAMRVFRSVSPLRVMARKLGYLIFKPPVGRFKKALGLAEFQLKFSGLIGALMYVYESPENESVCMAVDRLDEHLQDTANIKALLKRRNLNQLEMDF